jgi:hypothetical protein
MTRSITTNSRHTLLGDVRFLLLSHTRVHSYEIWYVCSNSLELIVVIFYFNDPIEAVTFPDCYKTFDVWIIYNSRLNHRSRFKEEQSR